MTPRQSLHRSKHHPWDSLALGLFGVTAVLVLLTFRDYGVTWDADVHNWYGSFALDYYLSGFADRRALSWLNLYNYGAAFDMVAAVLNKFSPLGTYETRHLLDGAIGVAGIVGCWRLGRLLGGPRAGLIAALLLVLVPNYYGQMFNNPKDIPFAVGCVWATYYIVRLLPLLPRPPLSLLAKLGLAIGLTMGVRIGGLLLICYLGLALTLDGIAQAIVARSFRTLLGLGWQHLWRVLGPVVAIAYPVMLLFWPWAQQQPIGNPLRALAFFSHDSFPYLTLFAGRYVPAEDLPWIYLPTYIVIALPELVLALMLAAPIVAAAGWWRGAEPLPRARLLALFLLGFTIVFPVVYAILIKAVLFDGMRHFLFVLPPIAVAAALVADRGLGSLADQPYRGIVYAGLALYGVAHVTVMVLLHPDEYVYANALVGGVRGAERNFKLDYWANSYAEAVRGLEQRLRGEYGPAFERHQFTVAVCGPPISATYFFPPNFRFVAQRERADFFIAFTKDNCDHALSGHPIFKVERLGALLSVVLDRRPILAQGRDASTP